MIKKKELSFMILTLVLCVLLFAERLTGEIFHAILGLVLVVFMAVHLGRQMKKLRCRKLHIQVVDWILMAALAALFVTGMLLHPMHGLLILKIVHKLAAVVFVLGVIGHIVQHRRTRRVG